MPGKECRVCKRKVDIFRLKEDTCPRCLRVLASICEDDQLLLELSMLLEARHSTEERFLGYLVDADGYLVAPCACAPCRDAQRGETKDTGDGHFQCHLIPKALLTAETLGFIGGVYDSGKWHWYIKDSPRDITELVFEAYYDLHRLVSLFLRKRVGFDTLRKGRIVIE